jgi:hypothetical protein
MSKDDQLFRCSSWPSSTLLAAPRSEARRPAGRGEWNAFLWAILLQEARGLHCFFTRIPRSPSPGIPA